MGWDLRKDYETAGCKNWKFFFKNIRRSQYPTDSLYYYDKKSYLKKCTISGKEGIKLATDYYIPH